MSKINKPNKPDNSANRPLNRSQPPQPPARESQKLEVIKIISPAPIEPVDPLKAKNIEADQPNDAGINSSSEQGNSENALERQTRLIAKAVMSASKSSKNDREIESIATADSHTDRSDAEDKERLQPIPPATEAMQYRAIGVIRGRYVSQEDNFSKGQLFASDGTVIDAVLLGKIISIVKKRLDMEKEYLWVVYPRTNDKTGDLHIQIAGVWAPVEMGKSDQPIDPGVEDGYFSVRGEVINQSVEQNAILIKVCRIEQKPDKKKKSTGKSFNKFKLRLAGLLPANAVGQFWDINVQRQNNVLNILDGQFIAQVPMKKPFRKPGGRSPNKGTFSTKPRKVIDQSGKVTIVNPQAAPYKPPVRQGSSEERPRPIIKRAQPPIGSDPS
ncbi:hypothetical protein V2H45_01450 [Tumidithrix elongata RA019]|uniref:Uncharacterized protein n=1 Tax=Tumidithrix elongata BACA0141 TaxID=2716417 RepID=A0AAW9PT29_9CYAN|nr:hypothetical protein [Tumidithrix elongata RA019]